MTNPNILACEEQGVSLGQGQPTDYTTCNPEDVEAQLDTEQAASLAPNVNVQFIATTSNEVLHDRNLHDELPWGGGAPRNNSASVDRR